MFGEPLKPCFIGAWLQLNW